MTIQEALISALRKAAHYNRNDLASPRVVLWPDGEGLWRRTIPELLKCMPELLVLDPEALAGNSGPSTWLRYRIAAHTGETPIVYLPSVPRQSFRGAAGFPEVARHLYALQFQGQFWAQTNGKDWTPLAFLSSADGGLDLDVARDAATLNALHEQLEQVLRTPVDQLRGHRLDAQAFHGLVADDPVRLLLQWMASDGQVKWPDAQWKAFKAQMKKQFKLDPTKDGVSVAAEHLVNGSKGWDPVWTRYRESARAYPGLKAVLERVQPTGLFESDNERMPGLNTAKEEELRQGLHALEGLDAAAAKAQLAALVRQHHPRISWVWTKLGEAPLALATAAFGNMLLAMDQGIDASNWQTAAEQYLDHGWQVDANARAAYAIAKHAPNASKVAAAVTVALRAVYLPWLEQLAERSQVNSASYPKRSPADAFTFTPEPGSILLFVDGLRADLMVELQQALLAHGLDVERHTAWSALPTVTATAKPAWAPMASQTHGENIGAGFDPVLINGKPLRTNEFRSTLKTLGWSYVEGSETGDPATSAWTEAGKFDSYGHEQGAKLAWRVEEELSIIRNRIYELFAAGWTTIRVITDHGWLWMPGDLPKVELPKHLTVSKWGRCAVPEAGATHGLPQVGWFWGAQHPVVLAPGISVFQKGMAYTHGGLTLQEALTPVLVLRSSSATGPVSATIETLKWNGLRVNVHISGSVEQVTADLRTRPADPNTSVIAVPKPPDASGKVSLVVENDDLIGQAAVLVVLADGVVLAKRPVTIGEN